MNKSKINILFFTRTFITLFFLLLSSVLNASELKGFKYSIPDFKASELIKRSVDTNFDNVKNTVKLRGSGKNIFLKVIPSVVKVLTDEGFGTGVIIATEPKGYILTNYHVTEDYKTVGIQFSDDVDADRIALATVVMFDQIRDLSLLELNVKKTSLIAIPKAENTLYVGDDVHAIGHPLGEDWTYTRGYVSQIRAEYSWQTGTSKHHVADVIQTQTPISQGNSGGPLVNDSGELVGVNTFGNSEGQGLNYSIANSSIQSFLKAEGNVERIALDTEHKDFGIMMNSWDDNKNGNPDAYSFDGNKNQIPDLIGIDENEDLWVETLMIDRNENNIYEIKISEQIIDGETVVFYELDDNEDEKVDSIGIDVDNDGKIDHIEKKNND